jgi:hypothetical protein
MKSIIDETLQIYYDTLVNGKDDIEFEKRMKSLIDTYTKKDEWTAQIFHNYFSYYLEFIIKKKKLPDVSFFDEYLKLIDYKLSSNTLSDKEYLAYLEFQKYIKEKLTSLQNDNKKLNLDSIPKNHVCYAIIELSYKYKIPDLELIQKVESNSNIGALLHSYKVEKSKLFSKDPVEKEKSMKYKIENQKKIRNKYLAIKELIENYIIDIYQVKQT